MKVIKMRSMQTEAFRVLKKVLFRMINAPTGSGKSAEICFLGLATTVAPGKTVGSDKARVARYIA